MNKEITYSLVVQPFQSTISKLTFLAWLTRFFYRKCENETIFLFLYMYMFLGKAFIKHNVLPVILGRTVFSTMADSVCLSVCSSSSWPWPWQKVSTAENHGKFSKSPLAPWNIHKLHWTHKGTCCVIINVCMHELVSVFVSTCTFSGFHASSWCLMMGFNNLGRHREM